VYKAKGTLNFDADLFDFTAKALLKGFKQGWDDKFVKLSHTLGITYGTDDPALLTAYELNLFRFAGSKSLALTQELNQLFRNTTNFNDFFKAALALTEVHNKEWLLSEYNTAILTGEAAATYNRLKKQTHIFPYWMYKTVGDSHVRPTHALLDGVIMPADDKRWDKIYPPNGWNCRCYIVPRLKNEVNAAKLKEGRQKADAYIASTAFKKEAAQGWGVNRGKVGEIFTANQMYINKFPNLSFKDLNSLLPVNYGLKQYSQAKKAGTEALSDYNGSFDDFVKGLEMFNEKPILRDYSKRPLIVDKPQFKTQAQKKHQLVLLQALKETLENPNEAWVNGKDLERLVYIKYYQTQTMLVLANQNGGALQINTWLILKEVKDVIDLYRRGLLLLK
jgi:SPP1 gp7 family putative phage head morphogenesis protein